MGYGKAEQELTKTGSGVFGWATALVWGGSFVVPGVLSLILHVAMWEMMLTIFGPLALFALWMAGLIFAEGRGWIEPPRIGVPKARWRVRGLAILTWAYLVWLETMLISAAATPGPLSQVGVPVGVVIDYLPIRVALYYVCDGSRFERVTIAISVALVLFQIATA